MEKHAWIDVMKGIGIISVVAGHIFGGDLSRTIFMFHMPLFFFLSGYLFKPDQGIQGYFYKKINHLLVPYVAFLVIMYPLFYGFPALQAGEMGKYLIRPLFGGRLLTEELGVFWFITCLFITQQLVNYLIVRLDERTVGLVMVVFLGVSYINSMIFSSFWLPWNANVVFAAAPVFYLGYLYRQRNPQVNDLLLLGVGLLIVTLSFWFPSNVYDMKHTVYGIPVVTLLSSIILTLNIKYFAQWISRVNGLSTFFSELGKASMVIMYIHQAVQMQTAQYITENQVIRLVLAVVSGYALFLLFSRFSVTEALFLGSAKEINVVSRVSLFFRRRVFRKAQ